MCRLILCAWLREEFIRCIASIFIWSEIYKSIYIRIPVHYTTEYLLSWNFLAGLWSKCGDPGYVYGNNRYSESGRYF